MDSYETRKSESQKIIERQDAVVYGNNGFLSRDQLSFYDDNGYLLIKDFFSVDHLKGVMANSSLVFNGKVECDIVTEPKSRVIRSAIGIHFKDDYKKIIDSNNFKMAVKSILGDELYIHQSRINFKEGGKSIGWSWHSDFETWHSQDGMPRMKCLSAMIPLSDNTIDNGALTIIPKSHKYYISCEKGAENSGAESNFQDQKEGVPNQKTIEKVMSLSGSATKTIECGVGDVLIFDCNLLHTSGSNMTNEQRKNLFFVVNSLDNALVNPYIESEPRPESMGARKKIFKL